MRKDVPLDLITAANRGVEEEEREGDVVGVGEEEEEEEEAAAATMATPASWRARSKTAVGEWNRDRDTARRCLFQRPGEIPVGRTRSSFSEPTTNPKAASQTTWLAKNP